MLGEGVIRETTDHPSEIDNGPSRAAADPANPVECESHAVGAASIFPRPHVPVRHTILIYSWISDVQGVNYETRIDHPGREDTTTQIPTQLGHSKVQPVAGTHAQHVVDPGSGMYSPIATIVAISSS